MATDDSKGQSTRIIHNRRHRDAFGSPYSPIYNTTTYQFPDTKSQLDVIEARKPGYLYTRWGTNPTIQELEQGLAALEQAEAGLAFASGMAAWKAWSVNRLPPATTPLAGKSGKNEGSATACSGCPSAWRTREI